MKKLLLTTVSTLVLLAAPGAFAEDPSTAAGAAGQTTAEQGTAAGSADQLMVGGSEMAAAELVGAVVVDERGQQLGTVVNLLGKSGSFTDVIIKLDEDQSARLGQGAASEEPETGAAMTGEQSAAVEGQAGTGTTAVQPTEPAAGAAASGSAATAAAPEAPAGTTDQQVAGTTDPGASGSTSTTDMPASTGSSATAGQQMAGAAASGEGGSLVVVPISELAVEEGSSEGIVLGADALMKTKPFNQQGGAEFFDMTPGWESGPAGGGAIDATSNRG